MAMARTVRLGDAEITRIGLGTNRLTNTAEHVELVRGAVRAGIGNIDTALRAGQREDIVFVPNFPLRGTDTAAVQAMAARYPATASQIALAWLLHRTPHILPIPGTLSLEHAKENLAALDVELSDEDFATLI